MNLGRSTMKTSAYDDGLGLVSNMIKVPQADLQALTKRIFRPWQSGSDQRQFLWLLNY